MTHVIAALTGLTAATPAIVLYLYGARRWGWMFMIEAVRDAIREHRLP